MKNLFLVFGVLFFLSVSHTSNAQSSWSSEAIKITKKYSNISNLEKKQINEVFGAKAQELVWDASKSDFRNALIHLLRQRITIIDATKFKKQKKTFNISDKGLANQFNKNLKIDQPINVKNFNPLKYNLDFFANGTYLYKIGNTPYYLQVESQFRKK